MALEIDQIPPAFYYQLLPSEGVHPKGETIQVELPSIAHIGDAALRDALVDQVREHARDRGYVDFVVAKEDGTYSHTYRVPRGPLNFPPRS